MPMGIDGANNATATQARSRVKSSKQEQMRTIWSKIGRVNKSEQEMDLKAPVDGCQDVG